MKIKLFSISTASILLIILAVFFLMSHSYQLSLESKVHYHLGNYKQAHKMAVIAHNEDPYNRMAATVMTQSKLALEYVTYNRDAAKYLLDIDILSKKDYIETADKIRMKFMSEIMIDRFPKLTPTVVIDKELKKEAQAYFHEFEAIHAKIIRSL